MSTNKMFLSESSLPPLGQPGNPCAEVAGASAPACFQHSSPSGAGEVIGEVPLCWRLCQEDEEASGDLMVTSWVHSYI